MVGNSLNVLFIIIGIMTDPCIQWERITKLETTLTLTNKNIMDKIDTMEKKIDVNHEEIKAMINDFAEKFVLKSSFRAVSASFGVLATIIGIIIYFTNK